jgi:predicted dehydrogenase
MTRRIFLGAATAAAAARVQGANDAINIGVIGLGNRGADHMQALAKVPGARIAAVCDVNQAARERAVALVTRLTGAAPRTFDDMRRMFADSSIPVVTMATPNHWHALGTIWACQAGKDVYVEKPACHDMQEGRQMIAAARRYARMVQVGSQGRSADYRKRAIQKLKEGAIGQVYLAKGLCFKRRPSIGRTPVEPVPAGLDWDQFLGPSPAVPFTMNRFRYNWHWFWTTGNGDIANQGAHEMDFARWALDLQSPRKIVSTGGKFVYDDDQETPNTQLAEFDYGDRQIVFEVRGLPTLPEENVMIGNLFLGSEGLMAVDQTGYRIYHGASKEKVFEEKIDPAVAVDPAPHFSNLLDAVRKRDSAILHAPIEEGVASANLCHLANASYRLGRLLRMESSPWKVAGDSEAERLLSGSHRAPYTMPAGLIASSGNASSPSREEFYV